ncbi:hypothetical protein HMPREF9120_00541 [Neisseria sp. oral taxon 020 str. F0370]|nr:hypothetical protein HMPREF9120_00541 [Neisseria sp. oral taxon 020 str. F0370]
MSVYPYLFHTDVALKKRPIKRRTIFSAALGAIRAGRQILSWRGFLCWRGRLKSRIRGFQTA